MRKHLLFLFFTFIFGNIAFSQNFGNTVFLQGDYMELAMKDCGCFGSGDETPPSGYHPNLFNNQLNRYLLGFVADPDKDGWNTGMPNRCGDYFLPGLQIEGFYLQVGNKIYENADACSGQNPFKNGRIYDYRSDSVVSVRWEAVYDSISLQKHIFFRKNGLFFTVEVELKNLRKTQLSDVYYMRTVDPDNEQVHTSIFDTRNTIVYQQPRLGDSKVLISAVGTTYGCYLGLGTKDCRARVATNRKPNRKPKESWEGQPPYRSSGSITNDTEIFLTFKLGDIAPGGKVTFAYAYVLSEEQLDKAFSSTDTRVTADGVDVTQTRKAVTCVNSPVVFEVINEAGYDWRWSPNIEIDTTRGRRVVITPSRDRTYTLTGIGCDTITATFEVKVRTDTANPTISCPAPMTVYLPADSCAVTVFYPEPTFWDDCTGETIERTGLASGSRFSRGKHKITYRITDRAAKSAECSFEVTVLDTTRPKPNCQHLIYYQKRGSCTMRPDYPLNFFKDNCGGLRYTLIQGLGSKGEFPVGTTRETYMVSDSSGNTASCSFDVTVLDTLPPVISHPPFVLGKAGEPIFYTVRAYDECDTFISVSQTQGIPSGGSYASAGVFQQIFTATDRYGNTATATFPVIINSRPQIEDQTFSVPENSPLGTLIDTVKGFDPNGDKITFRILPTQTSDAFVLTNPQGLLLVANPAALDYEKKPFIDLMVEVSDDGPGLLRDTARIRVLILDVNEKPTALELSHRFFPENMPVASLVSQLLTTDEDSFDLYDHCELIETNNFPDNLAFRIVRGDSLLSNVVFNYEQKNAYLLKVLSTEAKNGDFFADTVWVYITDRNDLPVARGFTRTTNSGMAIRFSEEDFSRYYFDEDGDPMSGIRINDLPAHGQVILDGLPLGRGDTVERFSLGRLSYLPDPDFEGMDVMYWSVGDGKAWGSSVPALLRVNPSLKAFAGPDQVVCVGDSVLLGGSPSFSGGTPPYRFTWRPRIALSSDTIASPRAFPIADVQYTLTVRDSLGSVASDKISLKVGRPPKASLPKTEWVMLDGQTIEIEVKIEPDQDVSVRWEPAQHIANPTAAKTTLSLRLDNAEQSQTLEYSVVVSSPEGCETRLSFKLLVLPLVHIPTGFSPNGDGINDKWILRGIEAYPDSRVEIFDRYGQRLFVQTGYSSDKAWDGTYQGRLLEFGSYFYVVDLGRPGMRYTGHVTILE